LSEKKENLQSLGDINIRMDDAGGMENPPMIQMSPDEMKIK